MTTETQIRVLRDRVYGKPISDDGWRMVRDAWMQPENVRWLQAEELKIRGEQLRHEIAADERIAR